MSDALSKPAEPAMLAPYSFQAYAASLLTKAVRVVFSDSRLHSLTGTLMGVDASTLLLSKGADKSNLTVVFTSALAALDVA